MNNSVIYDLINPYFTETRMSIADKSHLMYVAKISAASVRDINEIYTNKFLNSP